MMNGTDLNVQVKINTKNKLEDCLQLNSDNFAFFDD